MKEFPSKIIYRYKGKLPFVFACSVAWSDNPASSITDSNLWICFYHRNPLQ